MIIRTKLCKKRDCYRESRALGLCSMHYQRSRPRKRIRRDCMLDGCHTRRDYADGLCGRHHRARLRGEPLVLAKKIPDPVPCPHRCGREWHAQPAVTNYQLKFRACVGSPRKAHAA